MGKLLISVENAAGTRQGAGPVHRIDTWSIRRFINAPSQFNARISGFEPLANSLRGGYLMTFIREGEEPGDQAYGIDNTEGGTLLYKGVVLDQAWDASSSGGPVLDVAGVSRHGRKAFDYTGSSEAWNYVPLPGIVNYMLGESPTVSPHISGRTFKGTFAFENKYSAAAKALDKVGAGVVERWDGLRLVSRSQPEAASANGAQIIVRNVAQWHPGMADDENIGVIAETPTIRKDGQRLANRIIATGGTADDGEPRDIDLGDASWNYPFRVKGTRATGYYIEDLDSQDRHGLFVARIQLSDIHIGAGVDNTGAGNLLYWAAVTELNNRSSEQLFLTFELANPKNMYNLMPGYAVRAIYHGEVRDAVTGARRWLDLNRLVVIQEREDFGSGAGEHRVKITVSFRQDVFLYPIIDPNVDVVPEQLEPGIGESAECSGGQGAGLSVINSDSLRDDDGERVTVTISGGGTSASLSSQPVPELTSGNVIQVGGGNYTVTGGSGTSLTVTDDDTTGDVVGIGSYSVERDCAEEPPVPAPEPPPGDEGSTTPGFVPPAAPEETVDPCCDDPNSSEDTGEPGDCAGIKIEAGHGFHIPDGGATSFELVNESASAKIAIVSIYGSAVTSATGTELAEVDSGNLILTVYEVDLPAETTTTITINMSGAAIDIASVLVHTCIDVTTGVEDTATTNGTPATTILVESTATHTLSIIGHGGGEGPTSWTPDDGTLIASVPPIPSGGHQSQWGSANHGWSGPEEDAAVVLISFACED